MDYRVGEIGRVVVARFNGDDEVLGNLREIARRENIRAAVLYMVGGMQKGRMVVGPEKDELPPVPVWREVTESNEVLGIGTIFWEGDEPKIHLHGAFGKRDEVKVGCLRENSEAFLVLEAVMIELKDIDAVREFDPAVGLSLLKLG
ncbi:MAG: DNA-binding protein [Actinomycetota bacterium]|nr:DNA-binding protein [Actinomycetota bacterium]